jgi:hypothetical protein
MGGRARIVLVLVVASALAILLVAMRPRHLAASGQGEEGRGEGLPATSREAARPTFPARYDGGPLERTVNDRRIRDELRRRILAGWAQGEGESAEAARQGRFEPMPPGPNGEYVDPAYIQDVIRSDMFPMARGCYEELLKRQPDAGGKVEMFFKIVGDEKVGGIVDEVDIDAGAPTAIRDDRMNTCIRESLMSLAFRPPPGSGVVTIGYPIVFSPENDEDN